MKIFDEYAGDEALPMGSYAALVGAFNVALAAGLVLAARHGRLRDSVSVGDVALLGVATHKLSRLIAKDTVTSPLRAPFTRHSGQSQINELAESPRGEGPRQAIGQLLFCPQCVGQ